MQSLLGKVALVTGGASGIGRAAALEFASAGARVVVAGRRAEAGSEIVRLIREGGGEAVFLPHRRHSTAAGGISDKGYRRSLRPVGFCFQQRRH